MYLNICTTKEAKTYPSWFVYMNTFKTYIVKEQKRSSFTQVQCNINRLHPQDKKENSQSLAVKIYFWACM